MATSELSTHHILENRLGVGGTEEAYSRKFAKTIGNW